MKSFAAPSEELSRLLTDLVSNELPSTEISRLRQLLRAPAEREAYVDYMAIEALLRWRYASPNESAIDFQAASSAIGPRLHISSAAGIPSPHPIRVGWWSAAAAVLLCVGLGIVVLVRVLSPVNVTARIGDSFDAQFDGSGLSASAGTHLMAAQKVSLSHGLVDLTLVGGARVVIEAPAVFSIDSPGAMTLESGRISAVASGAAHGFKVTTPTASVVDLGTEFGVYVAPAGATRVQVFTGKVVVSPIGSDPQQAGQTLSANDSADVTSGIVKLAATGASPQAFVRTLAPVSGAIDVVDLASGGDGTTHRHSGQIAPVSAGTGDLQTGGTARNGDRRYHRISNLALFDGCFIPNGTMQVDSGGHLFEFPQTRGGSFIYVTGSGNVQWPVSDRTVQPMLGGVDYSRREHGFLLAHSNCGFTIDLAALQRIHPGLHLSRFTAVVGSTYSDPQRAIPGAGAYVLVDGQSRFERQNFVPRDGAISIDIPLSGADRFLTFAVINDVGNNSHNWVILGDPQLH